MLHFQCPSCQAKCEAAPEFAGKSVVCPKCGKTAEVPRDAAAITAAPSPGPLALPPLTAVTTPDVAEAQEARKRRDQADEDDRWRGQSIQRDGGAPRSWLQVGVYTMVILAIGAILVGLFVPSVRRVREAAGRTQSTNNLKQIALACHSFHDANKRLPFNGSDIAVQPRPNAAEIKYSKEAVGGQYTSGSWAFQILSYIDQAPLFNGFPGNDPNARIAAYMCPGRGRPGSEVADKDGAWTDYFYNNYMNDPLQAAKPDAPDNRRTLVGITDGTSNTILCGHGNINTTQYASTANVAGSTNIFLGGTRGTMRSGDNGNASPTGVTLKRDAAENPGIGSWGGPFPQGGLMAMGDATVRMFPYSMQNLGEFLTPTGGEIVTLPDT
jgi:type II secretory pathway pseudopilin PulG/predicted small lipoprotein YifL